MRYLGVGNIGRALASRMISAGCRVSLFSKKLAQPETRAQKVKDLCLDMAQVSICENLFQACQNAEAIALTLPFDQSTNNLIDIDFVNQLRTGTKVVSVSPIGIFSKEALKALHSRADLSVLLDDLESNELLEVLKVRALRNGFVLEDKACKSADCQIAMDSAVFSLLGHLDL